MDNSTYTNEIMHINDFKNTNEIEHTNYLFSDKYEIKSPIGEGGGGIVYLAWDRHLECSVAIKEEKHPQGAEGTGVLKAEMEFLKTLKHPMLPTVFDYFSTDKRYLVMEYIKGIGLHKYIEKEGKIQEEQACEWALQLLDLLSYLHNHKPAIIYRDLKPENIIVCPDLKLRVIDFGAALYINYDGSRQENLAGTPGYAAPEQLNDYGQNADNADERSDIYTFGATMYHMLTGFNPSLPPYGIRPLRCINPELTSGIERIVLKCTEKEPSKRYQCVEEIKRDIERRKYLKKRTYFAGFGKRRQYVIKRLEKNIWLTEKKTTGLI
ncbi:MAG: serine/threonine protein kinase [Lachnospiraceae bacterium]|nr:serine/threonine protein kinase [Lachnospiraceae bacterium]